MIKHYYTGVHSGKSPRRWGGAYGEQYSILKSCKSQGGGGGGGGGAQSFQGSLRTSCHESVDWVWLTATHDSRAAKKKAARGGLGTRLIPDHIEANPRPHQG